MTAAADQQSIAVEIADLVRADLASYPWPADVTETTVARKWLPTFNLEELYGVRTVHVVPRTVTITAATDQSDWHDVVLEVGVMLKPKPADDDTPVDLEAEADAQAGLVGLLADHYRQPGGLLAELGGPHVTRVETTTLMLAEHLEQLQQLTSVLRLTVRDRR